LSMVRFHAALEMTWKQRAHPLVSAREAYPRRVELITHTEVGNRQTNPRLARQDPFSDSKAHL
jgi:hypothetical protein